MDSRRLSVFRLILSLSLFSPLSIPLFLRRVFSLSPFDANISNSSRYISPLSIFLSLFSMTSNGFSSVLEPKCSYSYKDIRCRSEKCSRAIPLVATPCKLKPLKNSGEARPMHIFTLQRMIIFPNGRM